MPLVEDLLLRFRRIWSPPGGVAGRAGVPEEAGLRFDDEVRGLSSELGSLDDEAAAVESAAEAQAASIVAAAEVEAERVVEAARARLPALRAERAAQRTRDRQADVDRIVAVADQQAVEVLERARTRMPGLVHNVVAEVYAEMSSEEDEHARLVGGG